MTEHSTKVFSKLFMASCIKSLIHNMFVQCCGSEKWGDWRPHLAMILSNETGEPAVKQKAIATMGDTLGTDSDSLTGCILLTYSPL